MARDNRDPQLIMVELCARRRPGERLSEAMDRLSLDGVPDHGTEAADAAFARLNGHLSTTNDTLFRRIR